METADKALQVAITTDGIVTGFYQAHAGLYVVYQFGTFFNADNVTSFVVYCGIDRFNHLLGLTGAFHAHNNLNHDDFPFRFVGHTDCGNIVTFLCVLFNYFCEFY